MEAVVDGMENGEIINSFRDLRVWREGMMLVEEVYRITVAFPRDEVYGLTNQLRRAAVSIPSNIAEGHARESTEEYLRHVSIAQGSLAELQTQLEIAARLGCCTADQVRPLLDGAAVLTRRLYRLRDRQLPKLIPNSQPPTPNSR